MGDQGDALLYLKPVSEMKFSRLLDDCSVAAVPQLANNALSQIEKRSDRQIHLSEIATIQELSRKERQ